MKTLNKNLEIIVNPMQEVSTVSCMLYPDSTVGCTVIMGQEDSADQLEDIFDKFTMYSPEFQRVIMNYVMMFLSLRGYTVPLQSK